jgi:hypothetical protein
MSIQVHSRVSAEVGAFVDWTAAEKREFEGAHAATAGAGKLRMPKRKKLRIYGNVIAVLAQRKYSVRFDDTQTLELLFNRLKKEEAGAGRQEMSDNEEDGGEGGDGGDGDSDSNHGDTSEEEEFDVETHAGKRLAAKAELKKLEGTTTDKQKYTTTEGSTTEVQWTFIEGELDDHFPNLYGPKGSKAESVEEEASCKDPTVRVGVRGWKLDTTDPHNFEKLYTHLYPGDINNDILKVNEAGRVAYPVGWKDTTYFEFLRVHGLIIAATNEVERGHKLWGHKDVKMRRSMQRQSPNDVWNKYISEKRFYALTKLMSETCGDPGVAETDVWGARFRPRVEAFNANRDRTVIRSSIHVGDEAMCAFKPRTTKTGGLPNISFIKRKPKPLGTEYKNICCGVTGIVLHLEIQEGKVAMKTKPFFNRLGATAACALRLSRASTLSV